MNKFLMVVYYLFAIVVLYKYMTFLLCKGGICLGLPM